jgi:hypothetical protein
MTTEELREQNELLDLQIAKLEKIKDLWAEMPTDAERDEIEKSAGSLVDSLTQAKEIYNSDDFLRLSDLDKMNERTNRFGELLKQMIVAELTSARG